jgi:hypothetical protein
MCEAVIGFVAVPHKIATFIRTPKPTQLQLLNFFVFLAQVCNQLQLKPQYDDHV